MPIPQTFYFFLISTKLIVKGKKITFTLFCISVITNEVKKLGSQLLISQNTTLWCPQQIGTKWEGPQVSPVMANADVI